MIVKDLIKLLKKYDDDLSVCIRIENDYWSPGESYSSPIIEVDEIIDGYEKKYGKHIIIK